jgi:hypothetical protein
VPEDTALQSLIAQRTNTSLRDSLRATYERMMS